MFHNSHIWRTLIWEQTFEILVLKSDTRLTSKANLFPGGMSSRYSFTSKTGTWFAIRPVVFFVFRSDCNCHFDRVPSYLTILLCSMWTFFLFLMNGFHCLLAAGYSNYFGIILWSVVSAWRHWTRCCNTGLTWSINRVTLDGNAQVRFGLIR